MTNPSAARPPKKAIDIIAAHYEAVFYMKWIMSPDGLDAGVEPQYSITARGNTIFIEDRGVRTSDAFPGLEEWGEPGVQWARSFVAEMQQKMCWVNGKFELTQPLS